MERRVVSMILVAQANRIAEQVLLAAALTGAHRRAIDERADMEEAARQYVRKVTGFGAPAAHNREVFDNAVKEITDATERLMHGLEIR